MIWFSFYGINEKGIGMYINKIVCPIFIKWENITQVVDNGFGIYLVHFYVYSKSGKKINSYIVVISFIRGYQEILSEIYKHNNNVEFLK